MATQFTHRAILVVTAAAAAACNAHAETEDGEGGARTFTQGLSPTGEAPATHYWCSWALRPAAWVRLRGRLQTLVDAGQARAWDGNQVTPEEVLTATGLRRVELGSGV